MIVQIITKVNRGYAGKELGIPIPLLNKYKFGRSVYDGDYVTIKRCFERYVLLEYLLSQFVLTVLLWSLAYFQLVPIRIYLLYWLLCKDISVKRRARDN